MGVERAVTRWYVQRQLLLAEISRLEAILLPSPQPTEAAEPVGSSAPAPENPAGLQQQLEEAQRRLTSLGHCPRPMMG